jgi:hypothetical protein
MTMTMQNTIAMLATISVTAASPLVTAAASPSAHAELRAGTLAVGSPAELAVTVDDASATPPQIRLDGAAARYSGQMTQTTIVNGVQHAELTFLYTLIPTRAGALDIPALTVTTPSGIATTAPVHATVGAAGTATAAPPPDTETSAAPAEGPHGFVRIEIPSRKLYVGQAIPVTIRAYFRAGTQATLDGLPRVTSDAFTFSEVSDKPTQTQVEIRGVPYLMATWTAILSPAKPSDGTLGIELPVELAYREAPRRRTAQGHSRMRDLLADDPFASSFFANDPFFNGDDPFGDVDSMFDFGAMQQHKVTLRDDAGRVVVADLPAAGRPASFAGLVGQFQLAIDPPKGELHVGEPATVTIRVTGTGNFDRVAIPTLAATPELDTFAGKTSFTPSGTTSLTGTKTFTQTIVPRRAGPLALPAVTLAYFDPGKRAYATAETQTVALTIAPAPGGGAADPGLAAASVRDPSMAPNRLEPGAHHATLQPLFRQERFRIVAAAIAAAGAVVTALLVALAGWRRDPRIARARTSRRLDRTIAKRCAGMEVAYRHHDPVAFFQAAREALQARLGANWQMAPEAITATDVDTHLGTRGAAIRSVFEHADQMTYAAALADDRPLDPWRRLVRDELARLEVEP